MAACPRCGAQVPDDANFCTSCGAAMSTGAPPGTAAPPRTGAPPGPPPPPPAQYYSPPPKQDALPVILIVLVIVVVAIVAIAAIGIFWVVNEANSGNVDLSAGAPSPYTGPGAPAAGNERIAVNVTMTNHRWYDLPVGDERLFHVQTGNGSEYSALTGLGSNYTVPDSIPSGESRTFLVVFEIPQGAEPTKLKFNNFISHAEFDFPGAGTAGLGAMFQLGQARCYADLL